MLLLSVLLEEDESVDEVEAGVVVEVVIGVVAVRAVVLAIVIGVIDAQGYVIGVALVDVDAVAPVVDSEDDGVDAIALHHAVADEAGVVYGCCWQQIGLVGDGSADVVVDGVDIAVVVVDAIDVDVAADIVVAAAAIVVVVVIAAVEAVVVVANMRGDEYQTIKWTKHSR